MAVPEAVGALSCDARESAVGVAAAAVPLGAGAAVRGADGDASTAEALGTDAEGAREGATEGLPLGVGRAGVRVAGTEAGTEAERAALALEDAPPLGVAPSEGDALPEGVARALSEALPAADAHALPVVEALRLLEAVLTPVAASVGGAEGDAECTPLALHCTETRWLPLCVRESGGEREGEARALDEAEPRPLRLAVPQLRAVGAAEPVAARPLPDGAGAVGEALPPALSVGAPVGRAPALAAGGTVSVALAGAVGAPPAEARAEALPLPLTAGDTDCDSVGVALRDGGGEAESEGEAEAVPRGALGVTRAEALAEGSGELLAVARARCEGGPEGVPRGVGCPLRVVAAEALRAGLPLCAPLPCPVAVAPALTLPRPLGVGGALPAALVDAEPLPVSAPEPLGAPRAEVEARCEKVPVGVPPPLALGSGEALAVPLLAPPLRLARGDADDDAVEDAERLPAREALLLPDGRGDAEAGRVAGGDRVDDGDALTLALCEQEEETEDEGEGVPLRTALPVGAPDGEDVAGPVAAGEALPLPLKPALPLAPELVGGALALGLPRTEGVAPRDSSAEALAPRVGEGKPEGCDERERAGVLERVRVPPGVAEPAPLRVGDGGGEREAAGDRDAESDDEGRGVIVTARGDAERGGVTVRVKEPRGDAEGLLEGATPAAARSRRAPKRVLRRCARAGGTVSVPTTEGLC